MKSIRWIGLGALIVVAVVACGADDGDAVNEVDAGDLDAGAGAVDATRPPGCEICATTAACSLDAGSASCSCANGYRGDGTLAGSACIDIDECTDGTSSCLEASAHGTCTNVAGGFTCACATGYAGDGTTGGAGCNDIDECLTGTSTCAPTSAGGTCTNGDGNFTCGCAAGYVGDGQANGTGCTDVDECATGANDCDNFSCVNTPGAYRCEGLYAVEPYRGVLARLNPATFALLDLVKLTSTGNVTGVTAMVRHPQSGAIYVTAKVAGVDRRALGTLDFATGTISVIAPIDRFSSLAFRPDGVLFGTTGAGATPRKQLFTFDLATGAPTQIGSLDAGSDGMVICYDSDASLMYRFSGSSTLMHSFSPVAPLTTTTIPVTGMSSEIFGCRYLGDHTFLVHDIASRVWKMTTAGVATAIPGAVSALFEDVRATEIAQMTVPHTIRPRSGAAAGGTTITLRGRGLTGATAVQLGGASATSFVVVDDTTITAVTPALPPGAVDVVVTTPLGYPATWPAAFTFE